MRELDLSNCNLSNLPTQIYNLKYLRKLNLNSNRLTSLPPEIGKLTNLVEICLYNNQLSSLPQEIGNLTNLIEIKLYKNQLSSLPPEIGNLTKLVRLSLHDNKLTFLPEEFQNLSNLEYLVLSNNRFQQFPKEVTYLTNLIELNLNANQINSIGENSFDNLLKLTKLSLARNRVTFLPSGIGKLKNLKKLEIKINKLTKLPEEIGELTNLPELNLDENQLVSLPAEVGKLTKLRELKLCNNILFSLPPDIGKLSNLLKINLTNNQLSSLPAEIGKFVNLFELSLNFNRLTSLPAEIGMLTNLTKLNLSHNKLASLPPEIGQLVKLKNLDLTYNRLTSLPKEIGKLVQLPSLNLSFNLLESIPPEIGSLKKLASLSIERNRLTTIPSEIGNLNNLFTLNLNMNILTSLPIEIGNLNNLGHLSVQGNRLTTIPSEIGNLNNLFRLNLNMNILTSLPTEIGKLKKLRWLRVVANRLTYIPAEIGDIEGILELSFSGNHITILPTEIGNLKNLTELDLDSNNLSALPLEIGKLNRLKVLKLSRNNLVSLPHTIGCLQKLEIFTLGNNKLHSFPDEIKNLIKLYYLDISQNKLSSLPISILSLSNLLRVILQGNDLDIPPEILNNTNNPKSIFDYYRSLQQETKQPLNEVKIIIVGEGGVGKTSIMKKLLDLKNQFNPEESTTHGINIRDWLIDVEGRKINTHIWDFGGQDIMHATHQFFMTKRSLYIVVLDSRENERQGRLEYWLKIIESFGGDSPVIIVCNKSDEHTLQLDKTGLIKKYPTIRDFIEKLSCKDNSGFDKLLTVLKYEIQRMKHVGDMLPQSWFLVKEEIEKLNQCYIKRTDFEEICNKHGVQKSNTRDLLGFLHDLGIVLCFQDDPRLEYLHVLNPHWVTTGIYQLLTSDIVAKNDGIIENSRIREVIKDSEDGKYCFHNEMQMYIIDMMKKFELCFEYDDGKKILIPDLLNKAQPTFNEDEWKDALHFQYHYNVLPSSIISRFIVRMHKNICDKFIWKTGVVLKNEENKAFIKSDEEEKIIYLKINGFIEERRQFLSIIRNQFTYIHKTIGKVEAVELVPLPDNPEITVSYKHLLILEKKREEIFTPYGVEKEYDVKELLDGLEPDYLRNTREKMNALNAKEYERSLTIIVKKGGTINMQDYINSTTGDTIYSEGNTSIAKDIHSENNENLQIAPGGNAAITVFKPIQNIANNQDLLQALLYLRQAIEKEDMDRDVKEEALGETDLAIKKVKKSGDIELAKGYISGKLAVIGEILKNGGVAATATNTIANTLIPFANWAGLATSAWF
jgi:small GTP-binding protein